MRIFLLEDEEVLGRMYSKKLSTQHEVCWAQSYEEGKELCNQEYDLYLLDVGLGEDYTGYCIFSHIPANARIVMLSNYSESTIKEKLGDQFERVHDCLIKMNYFPNQLLEYVNQLI